MFWCVLYIAAIVHSDCVCINAVWSETCTCCSYLLPVWLLAVHLLLVGLPGKCFSYYWRAFSKIYVASTAYLFASQLYASAVTSKSRLKLVWTALITEIPQYYESVVYLQFSHVLLIRIFYLVLVIIIIII